MARSLSCIVALGLSATANALAISAHAPARPAVDASISHWSHAAVNRDVIEDDMSTQPPLPKMELVDMQMLDMECYDLETRMAEEWTQQLIGGAGADEDDDFLFMEADSLSASAFIRA